MSKANNLTDFLTDLADNLRSVNGNTSKINPQNFAELIANLTRIRGYFSRMRFDKGDKLSISQISTSDTQMYCDYFSTAPDRLTSKTIFNDVATEEISLLNMSVQYFVLYFPPSFLVNQEQYWRVNIFNETKNLRISLDSDELSSTNPKGGYMQGVIYGGYLYIFDIDLVY